MTPGPPRHVAGAHVPPSGPYDADILILALDRPEETIAAIVSALAQRGLTRHVIVLDQGSAEANLARLADAVAGRGDATLLRLDRNLGVAGGRNRAAAFGHGRAVAALDNDAEFADSDTLARAVAVLDADPGLAVIGMRIVVHATGADDLTSWGYPPALLPRAAGVFDAAAFVGAGHAIRRAAWAEAGPYDEALFFCWEEFDFCLRAIGRGWRVQYRGDIVVRHKVAAEQRVAWSGARWFYFVRNRLYVGHKSGACWFAMTPRYAGYLVRGLRNGMLRQTLRALLAAFALARRSERSPLSSEARSYLWRADGAHRGSPLTRLRAEVLRRLPRAV